MADRSKRVRLNVTLDVDFVPGTEQGMGGMQWFGRHVVDGLEIDGSDYVDEEAGDDFYVRVVDVQVADQ